MTSHVLRTRDEVMASELRELAPYAVRATHSAGRQHPETDDPYRTIFQRDRDRIIHSSAFRRLKHKTQVFVSHDADYYRTRLTHSIEVAQIGRALCRTLRLNEDAAEAIALAHDLGHTPFGHAGETAMHQLMREFGGFEHNHQSYRVVTLLEQRYPGWSGLNLSFEVREGIVKHSGEYDAPRGIADFAHTGYPNLEAQVVNLADEIAYTNHDLDDGLQSGLLTIDTLAAQPLWQRYYSEAAAELAGHSLDAVKHLTIRRLIHACIHDVLEATVARLTTLRIATLDDVRERGAHAVAYSTGFGEDIGALKRFLFTHLYRHYRVERMADKAQRIVTDLFTAFIRNPRTLPDHFQLRIADGHRQERVICDYIAGMTDRYACEEHARLFNADVRV